MNKLLYVVSLILAIFIFIYCKQSQNVSWGMETIKERESKILMLSSTEQAQMSSFIIIHNGTCIIVDGGWTYDTEHLFEILKQNKIRKIDVWLITHVDPDHSGALYQYLLDYKFQEIPIGTIYFNFPENDFIEQYNPDIADYIKALRKELRFQNTLQAIGGQAFSYGVYNDIQILTVNNRYDIAEPSHNALNNSSIVYKIYIDGISCLFLGDLGYEGGNLLLEQTPPFILQSDIVQMAHHGQAGVSQDMYKVIQPSISMFPCPSWLWTNNDGTGPYKTLETRKWINELGASMYVSGYGDVEINLNILKEKLPKEVK